MSTRYYSHPKSCEHCGDTFYSSRYDARFCSSNCRVGAHREEKRYKELKRKTAQAIYELLRQSPDYDYENTIAELRQILDANSFLSPGDHHER